MGKTLQSLIVEYVNSLPPWQRSLAIHILRRDEQNSEQDAISNALRILLEDLGLETKSGSRDETGIQPHDSAIPAAKLRDLQLLGLANVKNVNAIKQRDELTFSPNITVIYGKNGAGKSGFVRLLNNCFYSRGDLAILPNVFEQQAGPVSAEFRFKRGDLPAYTLKYPDDKDRQEFRQFAVFDSKSVEVHLNEKNELHVEPSEFAFFEQLASLVEKVGERFDELIKQKDKPNEFGRFFEGNSSVVEVIRKLDADTELASVKKIANFFEAESTALSNLEVQISELRVDQIEKRKQALVRYKHELAEIKKRLEGLSQSLSEGNLEALGKSIVQYKELKIRIQHLGLERFEDDRYVGIGSERWLQFIKAAEQFVSLQPERSDKERESCPLCRQTLDEAAKELLSRYWDFLRSKAESDLQSVANEIRLKQKAFQDLPLPVLASDSPFGSWLVANSPDLFNQIANNVSEAASKIGALLKAAEEFSEIAEAQLIPIEEERFSVALRLLDKEIAAFESDAIRAKEQELREQRTYLLHRKLLSQIIEQVEGFLSQCVWVKKAVSERAKVSTREITLKRKQLYELFLNSDYASRFHRWCEELRTPYAIDLKQRGNSGRSERQLRIVGKYAPSQVLSEGEQRAIAMADFFTEAEITGIGSGLIFDDPVTSQDHDRKELIAKKIVEVSKSKQVIVFTHDLSFVFDLRNESAQQNAQYACHWIEKTNLDAGIVYLNLEPSLEKAFVEPKEADKYLHRATAADVNPNERESLLRHGLSLLRTSYEAFIICDMLNGCLSRFDRQFKWKQLQQAFFDKSFLDRAFNKMEFLSGYTEAHLHSDSSAKPTLQLLESEIREYRDMRQEYFIKKRNRPKTDVSDKEKAK